jgi:sulfoxide reductase heme-binding subunit YedZ
MSARLPLTHNLRFYVLSSAILLSFISAATLRNSISNDQLYAIRLEQLYGLCSVILIYCTLILSPLQKIYGASGVMGYALFARRAIGVSAAYYAVLHAIVALWGQLGGLQNVIYLPKFFQVSLSLGAIALLILLVLAVTSTDKIIDFMTLRRWKQLHRCLYLGSVLILVHIWMIGTHIAYIWIQRSVFVALVVFFALESNRIILLCAKKYPTLKSKQYHTVAVIVLLLAWLGMVIGTTKVIRNYHSNHKSSAVSLQSKGTYA